MNHFFSNIPDTPYFYTDQKKAEDLRRTNPQEYEAALEIMPNLNMNIPKLFLKIKFNRGGEKWLFNNLRETLSFFLKASGQTKSKDKDFNNLTNILFEFYPIPLDFMLSKDSNKMTGGNSAQ